MSGWTGGQYSLYRVLLGMALAVRFAALWPEPLSWVAGPLALTVAVGRFDRVASVGLAFLTLIHWMPYETALLALHVAVPGAPYGSWEAAGREDPRGGWELPRWVSIAARGLVAVAWIHGLVFGPFPFGPGFVLAHLLAFNPGWIRAHHAQVSATIFYDGHCGLCHRAIRFLLAEDRKAAAFRFAPLEGPAFARAVPEPQRADLPDSVVLQLPDGTLLTRSDGALEAGRRLGGFWRAAAEVLDFVPRALLDTAYDAVAARRVRVFGRTAQACPLVPDALKTRFLEP